MQSTASLHSAVDWMASAAPDPGGCRAEWQRDPLGVALLPAGRQWDVLIVEGPLGCPTLEVLAGCLDRPGPVLTVSGDGRIGFFVPPGTATCWLGTGVWCAGHGDWIAVPYPGRTTGRVRWLLPPDGEGTLTDPVMLEMAMHETVARTATGR